MAEDYITTKRVVKAGASNSAVSIDPSWGIKCGDLVDLKIHRHDDPYKYSHCATKKVCRTGGSLVIFCDKWWGYAVGDMVVANISVKRHPDGTPITAQSLSEEEGEEESNQPVSDNNE